MIGVNIAELNAIEYADAFDFLSSSYLFEA